MADKLGISRNYVSMIEGGRAPSESVIKLFELLESSPIHAGADATEIVREDECGAMSPREKLRHRLKQRQLSIAQLAKLTKYPASVLDGVINGTGRISEDMARAIVRELPELTLNDLLDGSDAPRVMDEGGMTGTAGARPTVIFPGKHKTRLVPLLSWASAGELASIDALDEAFEYEGIASNVPGRAFAVTIRGDSMAPKIEPGDFAVVRADVEPVEGEIVLVRTIDGDVLCKRYSTRDGGRFVVLSSINSSYMPKEVPAAQIAWIYPVKQLIRNNVSGL